MSHEISLETLKGGAALEIVNQMLADVWENILDPNTDAKKKRQVVLKLKFSPSEDRETVGIEIETKNDLAPHSAITTTASIGRDMDGIAVASEFGALNPNQHQLPGTTEAEQEDDGYTAPHQTATNVTPIQRAQGMN